MSGSPSQAPRSLLRDPDFLKLWTGQTVSAFGTQVTILAVPILAAVALKVSPADLKTTSRAACVSMVTPPCASMVKTSPAPPLYVMASSLAGEFSF